VKRCCEAGSRGAALLLSSEGEGVWRFLSTHWPFVAASLTLHHTRLVPPPCLLQEELVCLKALWDMTAVVLHTFQAWSGMLWGHINVESLMEECKQLTKDLKHLPKAVRSMGNMEAWHQALACGVAARQRQSDGRAVIWRQHLVLLQQLGSALKRLCDLSHCYIVQVRSYDVFRLLEGRVKAMMLALPLVSDLHHPAMRDRHWTMLMKVGCVSGS